MILTGTVMDFEDDYEGYSNHHGKVRVVAIYLENGEYKRVNVWRKQEEVELFKGFV
jgi:pantothenate kinase-related protein Tda10